MQGKGELISIYSYVNQLLYFYIETSYESMLFLFFHKEWEFFLFKFNTAIRYTIVFILGKRKEPKNCLIMVVHIDIFIKLKFD
jgi:hypothetical protein